ncbi:MAG: SNF2-related protein [Melioribacteraceae bacterium]|jgi:non-specific serine/threonine protein kinase|nr:SNF2-related protein [Melioribacteraceae bacterium]
MHIEIQKLLSRSFDSTIRSRGKVYFGNGAVKNVQVSENFVSAKVAGTKIYSVVITFGDSLIPQSMMCSCPYFRTANCKHLAALLFHLDTAGFWDNPESKNGALKLVPQNQIEKEESSISAQNKNLILDRKLKSFISESNRKDVKSNKIEYRVGYSISTTGYHTEILPLRIRLRKDGSVSDISKARKINYDKFPKIELNEKLIIDYLCGYDNSTIYLGGYHYYKDDDNKRKIFNDIFSFLHSKEVYFEEGHNKYKLVDILLETVESKLVITEKGEDILLELLLSIDGQKIDSLKNIMPLLNEPLWFYFNSKIFKVSNLSYEQFEYFKENSFEISISKDYLDIFEKNFLPQIASKLPIVSDKYRVEEVHITPSKKIFLDEKDTKLILKIKFGYGEIDFDYNPKEDFTSVYNDGIIKTIYRDKEFEENSMEEIKSLYVKNIDIGAFTPRKDPLDFIFNSLDYIQEKGFEIFGEDNLNKFKVNRSKPKVSFNVSSGIDWFDVTTEVNYNGTAVPFSELVAAIKEKKKYLKLSDGSSGVLPTNWINKFKQTLSFGELGEDGVRFSKIQALALETILEEADDFETDEHFKEHVEKLKSFDKIERQSIPRTFNGKLRNYQKKGVDWLYFLKEYSFGGILADDMGLGKTIQSIILLLKEKKENKDYTSLIVAPTSVIFNWTDEISKFAPSLTTLNHTGIEREKTDNSIFNQFDVVLTSYGVLLRDVELLKNFQFHYIILDESQKIKNPTSKTGRMVRKLQADYRLCLTGTPIENNLTELWSQMAFLNPGLLGPYQKFNDSFVKPISKEYDPKTINLLKRTIYPFLLRRTKDVVAKDLPEKTETIHFCEMEKAQAKVYNFWKNSIKMEILEEIKKNGIKKSGFKVMEGLLRLRQICNHPVLVQSDYNKESSKFEEFKMMLSKVVAEGHKVLVFSQFVKMLEIMKDFLVENNIKYEYLTGRTRKREECVKNFKNNDDINVFLISLKAGGFGLNLTEADYVFHYDPWWNPAVEMQATDRTHRIGQDKNVFVYKFITKDSVEEKILYLQEKKKQLIQEIISTESSILKNITQKDIEVLFE